MSTLDLTFDKPLPASPDTERFVLGSVLLNDTYWENIADLPPEIFGLEKHRKIFGRMKDLAARGDRIDRVTLADELIKWGQLDSVDGLAYLVSLDDGLPEISNIESYIKILREKHALRTLIFTAQKAINQALIGELPPESIAASLEESVRGIGEQKKEQGRIAIEVVRDTGGIDVFLNPSLGAKGLMTGYTAFDEATGGLFGDQLVILGARPAMGKTAIAAGVLDYVADRGAATMFSLEMGAASIIRRIVCARSKVDINRFRTGHLSRDESVKTRDELAYIAERPLKIYDNPGMTLGAICKAARHEVEREGSKLIVIDHLGLISTKGMKFDRKDLEVGHITRTLKMLTKQLGVPILVLCQLSRDSSKTRGARPELHDLRNSGDIEQDADIAAFLYREEYYHRERDDIRGQAELIIRKQRDGGVGTCYLRFIHGYAKFENPPEGDKAFSTF